MAEETSNSSPKSGSIDADAPTNVESPPRRGFLVQLTAATIGTIVGLVPTLTGLLFFLDPLLRKRQTLKAAGRDGAPSGVIKDADGFIKMAITVDALPDDGTPQSFTVYDDKVDAWNMFLNHPIGTVWLRKRENGEVVALNTICPHLGCSVEYSPPDKDFYCPCHLSAFELSGEKKNPIPPRGMDTLKLKPDTGNEIWIKYETFRGTVTEKIPV